MTENYASSCIQALSDSEWLFDLGMQYVKLRDTRAEFVNKEFIAEA